MFKYLALLLALLLPFSMTAQNLVPNPGFEVMNSCPGSIGSIEYSPGYVNFPTVDAWVTPMPGGNGSPDYFNSCAAFNSGVHVPEATFGYQFARTGDAYAGIIAWQATKSGSSWINDSREYLQCKLLAPMVAGQRYCVTFYVSPSVSTDLPNFNYVSLDEVGVHFSDAQISQPSGYTMTLPYSVVNPVGNYLLDTGNWIKVNAIYTASGGEEWMTIGTFRNNNTIPNFMQASPIPANPAFDTYRSYMYFDDFSVVKIPADTEKVSHEIALCDTNTISVDIASSGGFEGTYKWNSGQNTNKISVNKLGSYWCVSEADCHVYIDTFNVIFNPDVKLNLGRDTGNCFNEPVTIRIKQSGFTNYQWNTGETTEDITISQTGKYYLLAENQCGLQADTINVYIQPPTPIPVLGDTIVCQNSTEVVIPGNNEDVIWYSSLESVIGNPYMPYIYTRDPGRVVIYASQKIGYCESERTPVNIRIKYTPKDEIQNSITMCQKFPVTIGNDVNDEVNYKWSTGEVICCILPSREGVYRRAVSNECGTYIDSANITMSECDQCIMVPNAFSPNADGKNDRFNAIITCPIDRFQLTIYNRWGNKVFITTSADMGWDGQYNGQRAEAGTYIYLLNYRSSSTYRDNVIKGNISLIR